MYVRGIALKVRDQDLEDLFGKYGKIDKLEIMYDPHTRENRGFGFVQYVYAADAENAIKELNGFLLEGRSLMVEKVGVFIIHFVPCFLLHSILTITL